MRDTVRKAVLTDADSKTALSKLVSSDCGQDEILRLAELTARACKYREEAAADPAATEAIRMLSGMPRSSLRDFPRQVRGMAERIETMTGPLSLLSLVGGMVIARGADEDGSVRHSMKVFKALPGSLRLYADTQERTLQSKSFRWGNLFRELADRAEQELVAHVKRSTGRPHFVEVNDILLVALESLGVSDAARRYDTGAAALQNRVARRRPRRLPNVR